MISQNKQEDGVQWFTVDIPKNTARLTSLQRIKRLSKKTREKMFVHYKDDKAFFKFLGESSTSNLFEGKELNSDPELYEHFIVQDGRDILVCKNKGEFFRMFPEGRGRRIEYTDLLKLSPNCLKSEVTKYVNTKDGLKCEINKICINDNMNCHKPFTISLLTSKSLLNISEDPALRLFGTMGKKIKYGYASRCKPARKQYKLVVEAPKEKKLGEQEVEQVCNVPVYFGRNVKTDEATTLPCLDLDPELKEQTGFNLGVKFRDLSTQSQESLGITKRKLLKDQKKYRIVKITFLQMGELPVDTSKKAERKEKSTPKGNLSRKVVKQKITPGKGLKKREKMSKKNVKKSTSRSNKKVANIKKRLNDQKAVKLYKKKGLSYNSDDGLKQRYYLDELLFLKQSLRKRTLICSQETVMQLRDLTDLPLSEMHFEVIVHVYPAGRGRESRASHNRQDVGIEDAEEISNQSDDETQQPAAVLPPTQESNDNFQVLNLPDPEISNDLVSGQIQTSAGSIFQNITQDSCIPTTNLATADEERSLLNRHRGGLLESRFNQPRAPPRHGQYADQPSRQRSFSNWPSTTGHDPSRMAAYGFFYTGRHDLVRCFQCGIGLKNWSAPDEPLFEHIKHSPDCQFLKDLLGQDLLDAYIQSLTASRLTCTTHNAATAIAGNLGPRFGRIRNPEYSEPEARLRSFDKWPASSLQRPQALVDAGLFYTGFNDLCRCFTCDGGLQRWDVEANPWIEHARRFPYCTYVRQVKGQEYINMVQQAAAQAMEEENPVGTIPQPGQFPRNTLAEAQRQDVGRVLPPDTPPEGGIFTLDCQACAIEKFGYSHRSARHQYAPDREEANSAQAACPSPEEEENRQLKAMLKCMECEENDSNILFLPCTHHRLCENCAENAVTCLVCGQKIDEKIKTYRS
ncbi:uncharacterized protein LOC123538257 [Mercenaria mercenaria]|uniref:uncharacterized protein LOC123538257 n=1 Tax=Mercenaria mercenaria TaxID=6596 RepID=UPI00234EFF12|nr:uncharacterized protein LOC123538257 [Mercenaria mercenaria]